MESAVVTGLLCHLVRLIAVEPPWGGDRRLRAVEPHDGRPLFEDLLRLPCPAFAPMESTRRTTPRIHPSGFVRIYFHPCGRVDHASLPCLPVDRGARGGQGSPRLMGDKHDTLSWGIHCIFSRHYGDFCEWVQKAPGEFFSINYATIDLELKQRETLYFCPAT